jgi:hypothetical protein
MGRSAVRYSLLENKIKYFTVTQPIRFRRLNPPGIDLGSRAMSAFSTSINTVSYILNLIFYILYTLYIQPSIYNRTPTPLESIKRWW